MFEVLHGVHNFRNLLRVETLEQMLFSRCFTRSNIIRSKERNSCVKK